VARPVVALLHGLGRSPISMALLARRLEQRGWTTSRLRYRSTTLTLDQALAQVAEPVARLSAGAETIHLVGHSLGGILALLLALRDPPANLGRVVQIGSPNGGAETAVLAARVPGVPRLLGPVLSQLDKKILGEPLPAGLELGCIAGDLPLIPIARLAGARELNDGTVTVRSAVHPGASDTVVLRSSHGLLPFDPRVARQVDAFLRTGRFERP
jgi:pimeloyl-ACP methyl ester carboxylesterase